MKKTIIIIVILLFTTSCETVINDTCLTGYSYDSSLNACVLDNNSKTCNTGYVYLEDYNACELIKVCNDNETYNEEKNTCSEITTCIPGYEYNEETDACDKIIEVNSNYQLVWSDEFDYTGLPDTSKWTFDYKEDGAWYNNELQFYTRNDVDNAYVDNGYLTITAIKETFLNKEYTSARLVTANKGDWTYGRVEVSALLPSGRGTWPAIWMLPTDWVYGSWPTSGEIDIMEHVGYDPNSIYATIHTEAYNHMKNTQVGESITDTTVESSFHLYAIEWEPGEIRAYFDDILYATFSYDPYESANIPVYEAWPFDEDFHLILNIAVGGSWGGAGGMDDSIWPQEMLVDYVRVYQIDYETGDIEAPVLTGELDIISSNSNVMLGWNKAADNMAVEYYNVYIDNVLHTTTSVNGVYLTDIPSSEFTVKVEAVDFAGNKSNSISTIVAGKQLASISSRVEAEDYANMSGIKTETTTDIGGGLNVGWFDLGDWIEYELIVEESGYYDIMLRTATTNNDCNVDFTINNIFNQNFSITNTGGWQNWNDTTVYNVYLEAGTTIFRLENKGNPFNINYIEFYKR